MNAPAPQRSSWLTTAISVLTIAVAILEFLLWGWLVVPSLGPVLNMIPPEAQQILLIVLPLPLGALTIAAGIFAIIKPQEAPRGCATVALLVGFLAVLSSLFWMAAISGAFGQVY